MKCEVVKKLIGIYKYLFNFINMAMLILMKILFILKMTMMQVSIFDMNFLYF